MAQQFREVPVAWFGRRSLEGAAQCGCDAGMSGGKINLDDSPVHAVPIRRRNVLSLQLHWFAKRHRGSEVSSRS